MSNFKATSTPENEFGVDIYPEGSLADPIGLNATELYHAANDLITYINMTDDLSDIDRLVGRLDGILTKCRNGRDQLITCPECNTNFCIDTNAKPFVISDIANICVKCSNEMECD